MVLIPLKERSSCMITLRLFSKVRRRFSTTLCIPVRAPSAAACSTTDVQDVIWPGHWSSPRPGLRLATTQPMRKPVIPYSLETPLTTITMAVFDILIGEVVGRGGLSPVEDQLVVDIVHDQVDLLALAEFNDLSDELWRKHRAGWIVGAVDDDGFGVGADRLLDILHAGMKVPSSG